MGDSITTKDLFNLRVVGGAKRKRIGKVRRFVFHPSERCCVGLLVKRPDAALMFHRNDLFVPLGAFSLEDGMVVLRDDAAFDREAAKALGIDWDACVIWVGMPVTSESGEELGFVDVVTFDRATGAVESFTTETGAANKAILGSRVVPGKMVRGFKRNGGDPENPGVILVFDEVLDLPMEGGAAATAGAATAVVADKAKAGAEAAKPIARKAVKATGEAVDKGSYAIGKQIGRASGMFAAFKEEYDKAAHGDGE